MYIERDKDYNLLHISFRDSLPEGIVAKTKEMIPGAYYELDSEGKLVGIEIVNTNYVLGFPVGELHLSGELLGVKEAAKLAGKDRANFLRDLASRADFPEPVARVASGPLWLSRDVASYISRLTNGPDNIARWIEGQSSYREPYRQEPDEEMHESDRPDERRADYVYKDIDQYEDVEDTDLIERTIESSMAPDQIDHEVYLLGHDEPEERKTA